MAAGPHPGERGHLPLGRHLVHAVGAGLPGAAHLRDWTAAGTAALGRLLVVGSLFVEHLVAAAAGRRRIGRARNPVVDVAAVHTLGRPWKRLPA